MTIEIVDAVYQAADPGPGMPAVWVCSLEITQASTTWALPATAPGTLTKGELQIYFDAKEAGLWALAQEKGYEADVWGNVSIRRVAKAFSEVAIDEFNILRDLHGLPDRTLAQLATAIKNKLATM